MESLLNVKMKMLALLLLMMMMELSQVSTVTRMADHNNPLIGESLLDLHRVSPGKVHKHLH